MIPLPIQTRTRKIKHLLLALLVAISAACASTGTTRLSKRAAEKVIEGQTRKDEIVEFLGQAEHRVTSDAVGVRNYLERVFMEEAPLIELPEGRYELWTYSKWSYAAIDPLLLPGHETFKLGIFILNRNNICLKKIYREESRFQF